MSWIQTEQTPVKKCTVNPELEIDNYEKSGGSKQALILAYAMICAWDIKNVIEIGCWQGYSAQVLGKALHFNAPGESKLISVDINENALKRANSNTYGLNIEHLCICRDSTEMIYKNILNDKKIGLAFIDGDHTYNACMADLMNCSSVMDDNGIMIVHDYSKNNDKHKEVFNAVNDFYKNVAGWQRFYLPENRISTDYHTCVLQKENTKYYN